MYSRRLYQITFMENEESEELYQVIIPEDLLGDYNYIQESVFVGVLPGTLGVVDIEEEPGDREETESMLAEVTNRVS